MIIPKFYVAWGLLFPLASFAQSFAELMEAALAASPSVQQQLESQRIARSQVELSYAPLFPKLSSTVNASKEEGVESTRALTLRADQLLFNGGKEYAEIGVRRKLFEVESSRLEDERDLVRYSLTIAMLGGSFAREKLRILESSRETQRTRLEELKRRFKLGQSREPDLIQAEVEFQKMERRVIDARGAVDASRRDLRLAVRKELENFEFPELDAIVAELRTSSLILPRPDFEIRSLGLRVEALELAKKGTRRDFLPVIGAYASTSPWARPSRNQNNFEVGLQAEWTLFEGLKTPRELEIALAEKRKLEIQLADLRFTRKKNVEQLKIERQNTIDKLRDLRKVVERAERALRIQQVDYRRGLVTAVETQTSIQNVLDLNLEQAELRYRMGQLRAEAIKLGELL